MIKFILDNKEVEAQKGETILDVARKEGVYIPTMCYLCRTTPISSCRMCVVEADNTDGFVLSCATPPVEGMSVTTSSDKLYKYRQSIIKLYDVNHPLQCGVCDKSGECDLQNKTLEFGVNEQTFMAQDQRRPIKNWGVISYDESLCILCEKCVSVCNEVVGYNALEIKYGGYSSHIKRRSGGDCIDCGECVSVCPVGAMHSTDFKYSANSWELDKIPASCTHCSSVCSLDYEIQHAKMHHDNTKSIARVSADREFGALCNAGRYSHSYENSEAVKDSDRFNQAIEALKNADTINFNSYITNEEALILQKLKELRGYRLINPEAKSYQKFLKSFSSITGRNLYDGDLNSVRNSDFVVVLGSAIATDNPIAKSALSQSHKLNKSYISCMHPIVDNTLQNTVSQFIKYEVGSEEGVIALLATYLLSDTNKKKFETFFDDIDVGYLSGESNVGEEELDVLVQNLTRVKSPTLILGEDLITHPQSQNIAKLAAMIEKYTEFKVVVIPPRTNSLGVSLICDLDESEGEKVVGYNEKGSFILSSLGDAKDNPNMLDMPSLNQQEGTFTNIDKKVVPTNAALKYNGYELNDIANALGLNAKNTIDYTKELPQSKGYQAQEFDDLPNYYTNSGQEVRGYTLTPQKARVSNKIKEIADIKEFNGSVIYRADNIRQFNKATDKANQCSSHASPDLVGSYQFATAAKLKHGDIVIYGHDNTEVERKFVINPKLTGTIAFSPSYNIQTNTNSYRYNTITIQRGVNE